MTSLMVSDEENVDRVVLEVWECQSLWISVLPPSINESMKHFTYINDRTIRFWLKAIKWIWDGPIDKIKEAKEKAGGRFETLEQFVELCWKEVINKKTLEGLVWSWAMDEFWLNRKQMIEWIPEITRFSRRDEIKKW
jgi:DNA polymerase-3 subunit alpha